MDSDAASNSDQPAITSDNTPLSLINFESTNALAKSVGVPVQLTWRSEARCRRDGRIGSPAECRIGRHAIALRGAARTARILRGLSKGSFFRASDPIA